MLYCLSNARKSLGCSGFQNVCLGNRSAQQLGPVLPSVTLRLLLRTFCSEAQRNFVCSDKMSVALLTPDGCLLLFCNALEAWTNSQYFWIKILLPDSYFCPATFRHGSSLNPCQAKCSLGKFDSKVRLCWTWSYRCFSEAAGPCCRRFLATEHVEYYVSSNSKIYSLLIKFEHAWIIRTPWHSAAFS